MPGYAFSHVCAYLCLSVLFLLIFLSLDLETSFLVCRYIFRLSRSSSYTVSKTSGQGQGQNTSHMSVAKYTHLQVVSLRLKDNLVHSNYLVQFSFSVTTFSTKVQSFIVRNGITWGRGQKNHHKFAHMYTIHVLQNDYILFIME